MIDIDTCEFVARISYNWLILIQIVRHCQTSNTKLTYCKSRKLSDISGGYSHNSPRPLVRDRIFRRVSRLAGAQSQNGRRPARFDAIFSEQFEQMVGVHGHRGWRVAEAGYSAMTTSSAQLLSRGKPEELFERRPRAPTAAIFFGYSKILQKAPAVPSRRPSAPSIGAQSAHMVQQLLPPPVKGIHICRHFRNDSRTWKT